MELYNARIEEDSVIFSVDKDFLSIEFLEDDVEVIDLVLNDKPIRKGMRHVHEVEYNGYNYIKFAYCDGTGWCLMNKKFILFMDREQSYSTLMFKINDKLMKCFEYLCSK